MGPPLLETLRILQLCQFSLPSSSGLSILHLFTCLTACHSSLKLCLFSFLLLLSFCSDCIISFDLLFNYLMLSFASSNLLVNPSRIFHFGFCIFHLQLYYLVLYFLSPCCYYLIEISFSWFHFFVVPNSFFFFCHLFIFQLKDNCFVEFCFLSNINKNQS